MVSASGRANLAAVYRRGARDARTTLSASNSSISASETPTSRRISVECSPKTGAPYRSLQCVPTVTSDDQTGRRRASRSWLVWWIEIEITNICTTRRSRAAEIQHLKECTTLRPPSVGIWPRGVFAAAAEVPKAYRTSPKAGCEQPAGR